MRRTFFAAAAVVAIVATMLPARANGPTQRDVPALLQHAPDRYTATEVGKEYNLSYVFGPYVIPAGQDSNRTTLDLPLNTGYMIAVAPDLVDAASGKVPTQQEAHIHHAHWFRVEQTGTGDAYTAAGPEQLTWVFGTGEEKTQGRFDDRANADPTGPMYGVPTDGATPQALIYMIHNKTSSPLTVFVVLDVSFIPGTRQQIEQAWATNPSVSPLSSHKTIHPVYGTLWGQTKDVTMQSKNIGATYVATSDGTAIASGSHLHPGGKGVAVVNLGPKLNDANGNGTIEPACVEANADPDADGYPGVTILNSKKLDRVTEASPYSENYQMGATKFGWRAPIHKGDNIAQIGGYAVDGSTPSSRFFSVDGLDHAWYEAMSYTGIYIDRDQKPAALDKSSVASACSLSGLRPALLGQDDFAHQSNASNYVNASQVDVDELSARYETGANMGMLNHIWQNVPEPLCGLGSGFNAAKYPGLVYRTSCGATTLNTGAAPDTQVVHVSGFLYLPGDLNTYVSDVPMIPVIKQGQSLTFVNDDAAMNVRHTITSCAWPCLGTYVSNFPVPTGDANAFDSGKIGNVDPIDGGLTGDDTVPVWTSPTNLPVGKYAYYCRIHPFMRGAFEVAA